MADILHPDMDSSMSSELGDPTAHHACSEHAQIPHLTRVYRRVCDARPFSRFLPEVEDVDEVLADG